jgi:hypothetical protein
MRQNVTFSDIRNLFLFQCYSVILFYQTTITHSISVQFSKISHDVKTLLFIINILPPVATFPVSFCFSILFKHYQDTWTLSFCCGHEFVLLWKNTWDRMWHFQTFEILFCFSVIQLFFFILECHPVHGKVYSIQHYVIQYVSDLRQIVGFLRVLRLLPLLKLVAII